MSNPLIIPGDDGDELYDVTAAAARLGMTVSTLRSHQYQDRKRRADGAGPEVPQPEDPDTVVIQLPEGAGVEWARIIEELMLRAGGAGSPVRLWSRRKLDAYLAVTRDPEARLARAIFGKDSSIARHAEKKAARAHVHSTLDQVKAKRAIADGLDFVASLTEAAADELEQMTVPLAMGVIGGPVVGTARVFEDERGMYGEMTVADPEAAQALKSDVEPGDIGVKPKLTAREVLEQARLRREAR